MQINQRHTSHFAAVTHLQCAPTLVTRTAKRRGSQEEKPRQGIKGKIWQQLQAGNKERLWNFKRGGWRVWDPTGRNAGRDGGREIKWLCEKGKAEDRYWHVWSIKEKRGGEATSVGKSQGSRRRVFPPFGTFSSEAEKKGRDGEVGQHGIHRRREKNHVRSETVGWG